jgi:hypothetical protein
MNNKRPVYSFGTRNLFEREWVISRGNQPIAIEQNPLPRVFFLMDRYPRHLT